MAREVKDKTYYVSNKDLYPLYVKWHEEIKKAKEEGKDIPPIPAGILDAIIKITTRISFSPKFIGYSFREDMISDAQYDCIRFADRFNPAKSENPFSYITTITMRAFFRRIDAEKTQSYIKAKIISETPLHEFYESIDSDDVDMQQNFTEFITENCDNLVNNEPMALKRKRKKQEEHRLKEMEIECELDAEFEENGTPLEQLMGDGCE